MSRLMNYAVARCITGGTVTDDSGLYVRDAATCISKYGVCPESVWPYETEKFSVFPPLTAFQSCKLFKSFVYTSVNQDVDSLKNVLLTKKVPIIFGIVIYSSFMTDAVATNGIVPVPNTSSETQEGGHCVIMIGFDDTNQWFVCANSWGAGWGDRGCFYLPYKYVVDPNLANDFTYLTFIY
jgi:hypothetical protein